MHEVARLGPPLPDAAVGLLPMLDGRLDELGKEAPLVVVGGVPAAVPAPREVQQLAERVELELLGRLVAGAYWLRARVAGQVELLLADAPLAADPVEDLQVVGVSGRAADDEVAEARGLALASQVGERVGAERRVADPAVAVVPV